jgi:bacitracin synthase 3
MVTVPPWKNIFCNPVQLDIISPSTAVLNILVQQELSSTLFASLRNVYFGGEKVNMKYLHRALEHQVLGKFVNVYGPTETTVFALFYKIDTAIPAEALTIPIGRPLPNTSVYIVDASFQLTPRGIPGELLIGGAGLSLGYHNHPDLTRKKFISNPFGHDLVYCTGDICRMRDDGTIEFLYRLDNQVKLRSQRLELTEIEFHLLKHELIADAIVLLRDDVAEDEKHLVGYVQPISSKNVLNSDQVRTFLAKSLPDYMVPSFIVIMSQLPLNHVGKIDKKSLPKPSRSKSVMNISDIVRQIFIQVLKQDEIDMNSGFFHLGGHSLSAMEIIGKLYERFSIQITIPTLFQAQSIAEFVRHVETQISKDDRIQLTKVMETNNNLSNVRRAPLTPTQQQFWIFWKLKPDNCYYNVPLALEISGHLNMVALTRCLHHLMCKYTLLRIKFEEGRDGTQWQEENTDWNLPLVEEFVEGDLKTPRILERLQYHSMKPFDLSKGHVCRFTVLHMTENRHVLLINFHHIVCDGYSVSRFVNELLDLYALGNSNLPTTSSNMMSFLDYATRISKISRMDHHLDSMVNHLRDFRSLTFDTNLGVEQGRDVGLVSHISSFTVPSEVAEKLRQLAKEHACTLYTVLLALFECFLSVYSYNASDIVLGSIMSTRSEADVNDLFGPLINTVPIHTRLPDNTTSTFIDVLHSVRASVLFAMEHQMVPFADIVQRLRLVNTDHSLFTYLPVFRVLFEMNSYKLYDRTKRFSDATEWKSLNAASLLLPYTKSDIDLEIMNYGDGQPVQVTFNGNRALFDADMVNAMANCYRCAIETVVNPSP